MKTLLKYITLLIIGGVIIPFYQKASAMKHGLPYRCETAAPVHKKVKRHRARHFYFLPDHVAKLLPLADFF